MPVAVVMVLVTTATVRAVAGLIAVKVMVMVMQSAALAAVLIAGIVTGGRVVVSALLMAAVVLTVILHPLRLPFHLVTLLVWTLRLAATALLGEVRMTWLKAPVAVAVLVQLHRLVQAT